MPEKKRKWRGTGLSDTGRYRTNNEDAYLIDNYNSIYIVSDGIGGAEGGEIASQIIVQELPELVKHSYRTHPDFSDQKFQARFQEDIHCVNDLIYREGIHKNFPGMGSTFVLLYVKYKKAFIAHMGDSRCYLYNNETIHLLTNDHTCAEANHILTKAMGTENNIQADIQIIDLNHNDKLLLSSDGLHHMITDNQIYQTARELTGLPLCRKLLKLANDAGGEDNITIISVEEK